MSQSTIDRIDYKGWPECYRVSNGIIELIATSQVGPRIISLSFKGERNLFKVYDETAGQTGGENWNIYGGHRLWHSPEDKVRTYVPDNSRIEVGEITNGLFLRQPVEPLTGIEKMIEITMDPARAQIQVVHRLRNRGLWPIEMSVWALSVMECGGFAVVPLPLRHHPDYLLPNRSLTLWPFTDLRDDRLVLGKDFILVRQIEGRDPTEIGALVDEAWAAYHLDSFLFVKRFPFVPEARYPDLGCSVEVYTDSDMLELETLGPLKTVDPGTDLVHEERWELYKDVKMDCSEEAVRACLMPILG